MDAEAVAWARSSANNNNTVGVSSGRVGGSGGVGSASGATAGADRRSESVGGEGECCWLCCVRFWSIHYLWVIRRAVLLVHPSDFYSASILLSQQINHMYTVHHRG